MKRTLCVFTSVILAGMLAACSGGNDNLVLKGIKVKKPTKTTYTIGENFDPTGMVVTAWYEDEKNPDNEKQVELKSDEYTYSPSGALKAEDNQITVTYKDFTATFKITVENPVVELTVKNQPTKVSYSDGDEFDPTGLTLHAKYHDGTEKDLLATDASVSYSSALTNGQTSIVFKVGSAQVSVAITVGPTAQPSFKDVEYKEVNGKPTIIITGTTAGTSKSEFQFNMQVNNGNWTVIRPDWDMTFDGKGNFTVTSDISGISVEGANQTWFPHFGLAKYAGAGDSNTDINLDENNPDSPEFTCGGHRYTPVTNDKTFNMPGIIFDAPEGTNPQEKGDPNITFQVTKVEYKVENNKPTIIIVGTTDSVAKKDFQFNMQISGGDWTVYDSLPWSIEFANGGFTMKGEISSLPVGTFFPHFGKSTDPGSGAGNDKCDIHVDTPDSAEFTVDGKKYTPVTNELTFDMPGVEVTNDE